MNFTGWSSLRRPSSALSSARAAGDFTAQMMDFTAQMMDFTAQMMDYEDCTTKNEGVSTEYDGLHHRSVQRVIYTSSFAAVSGPCPAGHVITEADWAGAGPYISEEHMMAKHNGRWTAEDNACKYHRISIDMAAFSIENSNYKAAISIHTPSMRRFSLICFLITWPPPQLN